MKSQKGFTLMELMVVIVIIGILAAVAIPKFFEITAKAKCSELTINFSTFERLKTFHFELHGDPDATMEEIGMEVPQSKWFTYGDQMSTAAVFQSGGSIGTAAKGGKGNGNGGTNGPKHDEGTEDADGNNGHGNDEDGCDSSNPGKSNPCAGAGNLTPFIRVGDSVNPNTIGGLNGHMFSAVTAGNVGSKCNGGMGIYSNWHESVGITRGDLTGGTCSQYMHSFFN